MVFTLKINKISTNTANISAYHEYQLHFENVRYNLSSTVYHILKIIQVYLLNLKI